MCHFCRCRPASHPKRSDARLRRLGPSGLPSSQEPLNKKNQQSYEFLCAVRRVLAGEVYLSENLRGVFLKRIVTTGVKSVGREVDRLADRELEVLALSGRGRTTREIAKALQLSMATVGTYRARIKEKMKFRNATEFQHFAIRWVLERK